MLRVTATVIHKSTATVLRSITLANMVSVPGFIPFQVCVHCYTTLAVILFSYDHHGTQTTPHGLQILTRPSSSSANNIESVAGLSLYQDEHLIMSSTLKSLRWAHFSHWRRPLIFLVTIWNRHFMEEMLPYVMPFCSGASLVICISLQSEETPFFQGPVFICSHKYMFAQIKLTAL